MGAGFIVDDDYDCDRDGCDHEDFDLDILTGRATCNMCSEGWYANESEMIFWNADTSTIRNRLRIAWQMYRAHRGRNQFPKLYWFRWVFRFNSF